jgi:hydrogenase maturation protease
MKVIGLGNRWRCDDGVGPWIVEALQHAAHPGIEAATATDGLALLDAWRGAETAVVIDALRDERPAGTVLRFDALRDPLPRGSNYSSHGFGLADAIELARSLDLLPRQLQLIAIQGDCFDNGCGLSPAVNAAARRILAELGTASAVTDPAQAR